MIVYILFLVPFVQTNEVSLIGIELPGRSVSVLQLLENYSASCTPREGKHNSALDQITQMMRDLDGEEVAKKMYNSLFFSASDMKMDKLMGTWYTVVDSKLVHSEDCTVTYMTMLSQSQYSASFSLVQYSMRGGQIKVNEGYGKKTGPDPGELLISTGHEEDECPYMPVRVGGLQADGSFRYIVLSQPLKFPTMVLARDPSEFNAKFRAEVSEFVERFGFMSPVSAINTRLHFVNTTSCSHLTLPFHNLYF